MSAPEFITQGDGIITELTSFRKNLPHPDTRLLFSAMKAWASLAQMECDLPQALKPFVSRAVLMTGKSHPCIDFVENATEWANAWEPVWEQSKGVTIVQKPSQWEHEEGTKTWRRGDEVVEVEFGGEPCSVLAKLLAMKPGGSHRGPRYLVTRMNKNCKALGIDIGLRSDDKKGTIKRLK